MDYVNYVDDDDDLQESNRFGLVTVVGKAKILETDSEDEDDPVTFTKGEFESVVSNSDHDKLLEIEPTTVTHSAVTGEHIKSNTEEVKAAKKKPALVTFQLEQPSGTKSIVTVSVETLRALGIYDEDDEDEENREPEIKLKNCRNYQTENETGNASAAASPIYTIKEDSTAEDVSEGMPDKDLDIGEVFCHREYDINKEGNDLDSTGQSSQVKDVSDDMNLNTSSGAKIRRTRKISSHTYSCAYCQQTFSRMSLCREHLLTHLEEEEEYKPFKCNRCFKGFKSKYGLQQHIKNHDGNNVKEKLPRVYQCPDCAWAFYLEKDLKRHSVTHSGVYRFHCTLCNSKNKRKDNFERHLKNTHNMSRVERKRLSKEVLQKYLQSVKSNGK